jgi:signal transduction histidine kinase
MEHPARHLPPLTAGDAVCLLPLSDATATVLLSALVNQDGERRVAALERALRDDPVLTVWCAVHPRRDRTAPRDIHDLARWLGSRAVALFQWPESGLRSSDINPEWEPASWRSRLAWSFALAERAERIAAAEASPSRVRLLAFLSGALEWLLASSLPRDVNLIERFAPPWLRDLLASAPDSRDPAFKAVAEASRAARESPLSDVPPVLPCLETAAATREVLPALARRLARLEALEREFETQLLREKLASLQKLAYGASHEINNPLANIATRAQTLLLDETDPERRRALATINDQAFRAFEMIANMMLFAKPPDLDLAPTDLRQVATRAIDEMTPAAQQQGTVLLSRLVADAPLILADATQLAVLLRALLRNALEAVECGGEVEVRVAGHGDDEVHLLVRDTGPGLSQEARPPFVRPLLFQP